MKIVVLADTHVSNISQLPEELVRLLKKADVIVHLGDYTGKQLLDELRQLGRFEGVYGNIDSASIRRELPEERVLEVEGKRIALVHGWGAPFGLEEKIRARFPDVDAILYAHTHIPVNKVVEGVTVFNPGSATGRFPAREKTCGILAVADSIQGEVVRL